jgi:adenylate cyclase
MWERRLRLSSGLVIAAWVLTHFYNHSLGIIALDAMESFRFRNAAFWQHPAGSVALYGAFTLHFGLALWSLYRRRTLRMPLWEAAQLGLGLAVPFMIAAHVVGTRINQWQLDFDVGYPYVVSVLWSKDWLRVKQTLLLLIVWSHFCVGVHFWLRLKRGYRRAAPLLFAVAVVFPVLALTGFARAGLETQGLMLNPDAASAIFAGWNAAAPEQRQLILDLQSWTVYGFAGILGLVLAARGVRRAREKRRGHYRIRHVSGRVVSGRVGQTVLEALRQARVPHASVCGGRGRCTTCRIRVGDGIELLASPSRLEIDALQRIAADPNVRLACQTRPAADLSIAPLVPSDAGPEAAGAPGGVSGREQQVAAMFVDLRESTRLGEGRLPYDVVFILNQFFAEMSAALAATGGHYAQFAGDGLMALYGMRTSLKRGCQQALYGAIEMNRRLEELNRRLAEELDSPLRMGIGVHCGDAIVGTMGPPNSPNLSAVGDNVNIAARLESQSKVLNAPLVISTEVADAAGVALDEFPKHLAPVRGRGASVPVFAVSDFARLEALLDAVAGSAESAAGRRETEGAGG